MINKCQHCGKPIAFPSEAAGQTVECMNCGEETLLNPELIQSLNFFVWENEQQQGPFDQETIQRMISVGQITHDTLLCPEDGGLDWTPAKELFFQYSTPDNLVALNTTKNPPQARPESFVKIILTSGAELKIKAVWLYDANALAEINAKRTEAMEKLRGVSTGLGSIGSIGWVLASSVVIGAVEGALSAGAASSGSNLLAQVIKMEQALRTRGVICPVGKIENIETPHPGLWRVYSRKIQSTLIHSGDDFLTVQIDNGSACSIRWSTVESYIYGE
jgi:GYF domain 2